MKAEWFIRDNKLHLSVAYRQQNETSDGTSGCSSNWLQEVTTSIKDAAEIIVGHVKKDWNWQAIEGLNDWTKLPDDSVCLPPKQTPITTTSHSTLLSRVAKRLSSIFQKTNVSS